MESGQTASVNAIAASANHPKAAAGSNQARVTASEPEAAPILQP
jgi:hypothetical protein